MNHCRIQVSQPSVSVLKTPHHRSLEGVGRFQEFRPLKHSHTDAMPATKSIALSDISIMKYALLVVFCI